METYISCLVSSYIYNIVRIYNQVLMASTKFNSKKEIIVYMMHVKRNVRHAEAYSEPRQTPKTKRFETVINGY